MPILATARTVAATRTLASARTNASARILSGTRGYSGLTQVVDFPKSAGNNMTSPWSSVLAYAGDSDIRVKCAADDWTSLGNQTLFAQWVTTGNQRRQQFQVNTDGTLRYQSSANGTAIITSDSTAAVSFTDGAAGWVRVTLDVDDGGGNHVVTFYTSTNGVAWTQLGATITTAGTTSLFNSSAGVEIGSTRTDAADRFGGKLYRVMVYSGIGGTLVFDVDPTDQNCLYAPFNAMVEKGNGALVTLNRSGSPQLAVEYV